MHPEMQGRWRETVQKPEEVFAECLAELDRSRRTLGGLANQFSAVFDLVDAILRHGQVHAALELIEQARKAVAAMCLKRRPSNSSSSGKARRWWRKSANWTLMRSVRWRP